MAAYDPMKMARETAEQQAEAINPRAKRKSGLSVTLDPNVRFEEQEGERNTMTESLRQLSVASCASEWVDTRANVGSSNTP